LKVTNHSYKTSWERNPCSKGKERRKRTESKSRRVENKKTATCAKIAGD